MSQIAGAPSSDEKKKFSDSGPSEARSSSNFGARVRLKPLEELEEVAQLASVEKLKNGKGIPISEEQQSFENLAHGFEGFGIVANSTASLKHNYMVAKLQKSPTNSRTIFSVRFDGMVADIHPFDRKRRVGGAEIEIKVSMSNSPEETPFLLVRLSSTDKLKATKFNPTRRQVLIVQSKTTGETIVGRAMHVIAKRRRWTETPEELAPLYFEAQRQLDALFSHQNIRLEDIETVLSWISQNQTHGGDFAFDEAKVMPRRGQKRKSPHLNTSPRAHSRPSVDGNQIANQQQLLLAPPSHLQILSPLDHHSPLSHSRSPLLSQSSHSPHLSLSPHQPFHFIQEQFQRSQESSPHTPPCADPVKLFEEIILFYTGLGEGPRRTFRKHLNSAFKEIDENWTARKQPRTNEEVAANADHVNLPFEKKSASST